MISDGHCRRRAGHQLLRRRNCLGQLSQANQIQNNLNGGSDIFVTKLGPTLNLAVTEAVTPLTVGVGNDATFTYTITNNGDLTTGIIFTDVLPSTATFVSANEFSRPVQLSGGDEQHGHVHRRNFEWRSDGNRDRGAGSHAARNSPAAWFGERWRQGHNFRDAYGGDAAVPAVAIVNNYGIGVSPTTVTVPGQVRELYRHGHADREYSEYGSVIRLGCAYRGNHVISQRYFIQQPEQRAAKPPAGGQHHRARHHAGQSFPRRPAFLCGIVPGLWIGAAGRRHWRKEVAPPAYADGSAAGLLFRVSPVPGWLRQQQHRLDDLGNSGRHLQSHRDRNLGHGHADAADRACSAVKRFLVSRFWLQLKTIPDLPWEIIARSISSPATTTPH